MNTLDSLTEPRDNAAGLETPLKAGDVNLGGTPAPSAGTAQQTTASPAARGHKRWAKDPVAIAFVSANVGLLALAVFALASFGSIGRAIGYYLRGETLLFDATEKTFAAEPGNTVHVSFELTNKGINPIRIVGCQSVCTCTVPKDLPYTLGPGQTKELVLTVEIPTQYSGANHLSLPLTLFTTSSTQSRIPLMLQGDVRERPSEGHPTL